MSVTMSDDKVSRLVQVRTGFNNIFKTKLEVDAKKLKNQLDDWEDNEAKGDTAYWRSDSGLEAMVEAKFGQRPKRYIKLGPMEITYWCDYPKRIAEEFRKDAAILHRIEKKLVENLDKLIDLWVKALVHYERMAAEADGKGDADGIWKAQFNFTNDCATLQKECEQACVEVLVLEFTTTIKAMGNYTRYKVKAGAKLTVSVVGVVTAIVALGTAATPAAPATLVPAIAGIGVGLLSIGKQIGDLAISAETCEGKIRDNLDNWKGEYVDAKGQPKKYQFKARELVGGVFGGLSGGASEWVFPTIGGTLDIVSRHARKIDGLVVKVHELGVRATDTQQELVATKALLELHEQEAGKHERDSKEWAKLLKDCIAAKIAIATIEGQIVELSSRIPKLEQRIENGRIANETMKADLKAIESALGTKNYALVGQLLASVALTASGGAGMAMGGSSTTGLSEAAKAALEFKEHLDKINTSIAIGVAGFDVVKEYTPEIMSQLVKAVRK